jgi:nitrate reductase gamma subunit
MVLSILTYVAFATLIIVLIYRAVRIASAPIHLRWELYPVPHETGGKAKYGGSYLEESDWWTNHTSGSKLGELTVMIPEILFLKGVWESNRGLWFWSWGFHFGLYLLIAAFMAVIAGSIIGPVSTIGQLAGSLANIAIQIGCLLGALGTVGMIIKRATDDKLKLFTSAGSIFNLLFILAIFVSGLAAIYSLTGAGFISQLSRFFTALLTFSMSPALETAVVTHLVIVMLFMIYLPFTHMAHVVMKYFTYHSVRWNDTPNLPGSDIEKKINQLLQTKPTWAAEHIGADGKKNWVDIATEEIAQDDKKTKSK